jgi:hypothetical protein
MPVGDAMRQNPRGLVNEGAALGYVVEGFPHS